MTTSGNGGPAEQQPQLNVLAQYTKDFSFEIGTMMEIRTKDVSVLNVSAGPGVRFVITSPEKGAVTYHLAAGDMARFEKALYAVRDYLSK
jgi:hypothetical protein